MLFLTLAITYFVNLWCIQGVSADSQCATGHLCTPSLYQSPRFRWWWPGGWVEPDEIGVEITAIVDAGFGGAEIGDMEDSITVQLDAQVYGWGQARWNSAILRAYQESNSLGAHVDLTLGPHWPTGFPGYTPDSPETSKELVHGQGFVQPGQEFSGSLPLPMAAPSGSTTGNPNVQATPFLAAVLVARTTTTNESARIVNIDPPTVKLITSQVTNGSLTWTVPSDGTYVLVAAYGRGTGKIQNMYDGNPDAPKVTYPFPAYIVDRLSPPAYWLVSLGSIFEDSLELKFKQYWTMNFLQEFRQRRGYDLDPFLLYVIKDTNTFEGDPVVATQIQNDFYQTVSDLYVDYRLGGLKESANSIGLKLRVQRYTATIDSAYAASVLDIPEGESLGFEGDNDAFRVLAAGRDIGGKTTILLDELGAYFGMAYGVTWKFILRTANLDMSLGASQVVIHGFPYRDSPTNAWGPRQPQWIFANNASLYLANAQKLLQDSGASIDIAILNQAWGVTAAWDDTSLNDAGYSYQFPTPQLLSTYNAQVLKQRLAPSGPNYKALIINQTTIDVYTAQLLLSYGKSGLPIVISGPTSNTTFSYSPLQGESGAQIASILSQLTSLKSTRVVSDIATVPLALQQLDVKPSIQYPQGLNNTLITYRRTVSTGYVYWVYNNGDSAVKETVQLEGHGWPMLINLWTGEVNAVASFTYQDGYTALNISIASTASAAI